MKLIIILLISSFIFLFANELKFTKNELDYLKNKKTIKVCLKPTWYKSVKMVDSTYIRQGGFGITLLKEITSITNQNIDIVDVSSWSQTLEYLKDGRCDVIPLAQDIKKRRSFMNFANVVVSQPIIVASNDHEAYVKDFTKLRNKKFSIVKGYSFIDEIKNKYPNLRLRIVDTNDEAAALALEGKVFGYISTPAMVSYYIKEHGSINIHIVGELKKIKLDLSIGTIKNEPELVSIFNKVLTIIPDAFLKQNVNNWYAINIKQEKNYEEIIRLVVLFFLIILIMFIWNEKTHKYNLELEKLRDELYKKNKELEELSVTDKLTGLYNRRKLEEFLALEKEKALRYGNSFGIIIVDIDYFKDVNDTFGHQIGDIVLKEFASILKGRVRKTDILARWGGEEFIIVCIESNLEQTKIVAEYCRKAVDEFTFTKVGHKTASFGVSSFNKTDDVETVINRADVNLYEAKENGRNQVV